MKLEAQINHRNSASQWKLGRELIEVTVETDGAEPRDMVREKIFDELLLKVARSCFASCGA